MPYTTSDWGALTTPLSEPVRVKTDISKQRGGTAARVPLLPLIPWFAPLSEPKRFPNDIGTPGKPAFFAELHGMLAPETVMESKFHAAWSEPVRTKIAAGLAVAIAASGLFSGPLNLSQIPLQDPVVWLVPWKEPPAVKRLPIAAYPCLAWPEAAILNPSPTWFIAPFDEPVRVNPGYQFAAQRGRIEVAVPLPTLPHDFVPFSDPIRRIYSAALTPFVLGFGIVTPQGWLNAFSDPMRRVPSYWWLNRYEFAPLLVTFPEPPLLKWYEPWADPVRSKPRLSTAAQQATAYTYFIPHPSLFLQGWYTWLSEPVRRLRGLGAVYQQAQIEDLNPISATRISLTLSATEVNADVAEFGVFVYTPKPPTPSLTGARVSLVEIPVIEGGNVSIKGDIT